MKYKIVPNSDEIEIKNNTIVVLISMKTVSTRVAKQSNGTNVGFVTVKEFVASTVSFTCQFSLEKKYFSKIKNDLENKRS